MAAGQLKPKDVIALCKEMAAAGVHQAIFNMPDTHDIKPIEQFGREIIPAVAGF
jgi:hypothetical protein